MTPYTHDTQIIVDAALAKLRRERKLSQHTIAALQDLATQGKLANKGAIAAILEAANKEEAPWNESA